MKNYNLTSKPHLKNKLTFSRCALGTSGQFIGVGEGNKQALGTSQNHLNIVPSPIHMLNTFMSSSNYQIFLSPTQVPTPLLDILLPS